MSPGERMVRAVAGESGPPELTAEQRAMLEAMAGTMKATLVSRSEDRATVRLTPNWLGRWLGAQAVDVDLVRWTTTGAWRTEATGRDISYVRHDGKIRHALDFVPVPALPRAIARDFVELRR